MLIFIHVNKNLSVIARRGFVLGVVLLACLLMAVFIFSYNSVVRQQNIKAHHHMISETAGYLAVSGLRLLTDSIDNSSDSFLRTICPQLFIKTPDELGSEIKLPESHPFCAAARSEFQKFLNTLEDMREPGILGGYPTCAGMEITFKDLVSINPDTTPEQFQAGRDAVEKCGLMEARCIIVYRGIRRQAVMTRQFRVVSMIPGPFSRFSLFVKKTPYPDSYNALGVKFDGEIDTSYSHLPASGKAFTSPLFVFNGTDSTKVDGEIGARDSHDDGEHLRSRGWVFIGPAGNDKDEAVFIKIPSGFIGPAGGHFMLGWPSISATPVLAPEIISDNKNFASDSNFPEHEFLFGGKYQGFYTWEEGNPFGAGARNLWPGLAAGEKFEPSDHIRSASTWLYLFGNQNRESRTLVIGPVLAGFLKFFFIEGHSSVTGGRYKGLWGGMTEAAFKSNIENNQPLPGFTDLWGGTLSPPIHGSELFLCGFESFKKIMPYNSLPSPSSVMPVNGIAFNMIFDFMKYQRDRYPSLEEAPGIAAPSYDVEEFLVPQAEEMRNSVVKGLHPHDEVALFFDENGQYDPYLYPDNCYFFGNLESITIFDSNLVSARITHRLDLRDCKSKDQEQEALEKFLFKKAIDGGKEVNVTDKSGIFLVSRRKGISGDFSDALDFSRLPVRLEKPLIVIFDNGSLSVSNDIISPVKDGAPEVLCSLALVDGHFFIAGDGLNREIHAYMAALNPASGRLLKGDFNSGPTSFRILGGLALTEMGLYESPVNDPLSHLGTTMSNFPGG
ncbi:MAG: hypothetical protein ACOYXC_01835, partial [Candidatus Rifleibacteriota bacterium]